MVGNRLNLTAKDILDKNFRTSMRGYNQEEVDKFLDIIIKDYEMFSRQLNQLQRENERLKRQSEVKEQVRPQAEPLSGTTNFDILQRLSNLEKHVFGSKL